MNEILKQKLSSRKLWSMITALVIALGILYKVDQGTMESVVAVIGSFSAIIAYVLGESYIDGNR